MTQRGSRPAKDETPALRDPRLLLYGLNIRATNGVIHTIDRVLVPAQPQGAALPIAPVTLLTRCRPRAPGAGNSRAPRASAAARARWADDVVVVHGAACASRPFGRSAPVAAEPPAVGVARRQQRHPRDPVLVERRRAGEVFETDAVPVGDRLSDACHERQRADELPQTTSPSMRPVIVIAITRTASARELDANRPAPAGGEDSARRGDASVSSPRRRSPRRRQRASRFVSAKRSRG